MKWILFLCFILPSLLVLSGCGTDTVYQANCPLSNQPQVVQNFFAVPVQCMVNGPHMYCSRVMQ